MIKSIDFEKVGVVTPDSLQDYKIWKTDTEGRYVVHHNGVNHEIHIEKTENSYIAHANGIQFTAQVKSELDHLIASMGLNNPKENSVKEVVAPMPGLVLNIDVEVGREVSEGEPLLTLEAMKMENIIKSPCDGVIQSIEVNPQEAVEKNQILILFE